jgi:cytochrome c oxidase subunit 2
LKAEHAGIFRGQCAEYCGGPHALMAFEVVAMQPDEFDAWLEQQAAPSVAPTTDGGRRGRELFLAAGCGSCHTVRGTTATGTIGPDLTHLGSRGSVGIDTAAMTDDNVARFIRDGQHVKPGNLMPPFRIFAPADLVAVSAYLTGLR